LRVGVDLGELDLTIEALDVSWDFRIFNLIPSKNCSSFLNVAAKDCGLDHHTFSNASIFIYDPVPKVVSVKPAFFISRAGDGSEINWLLSTVDPFIVVDGVLSVNSDSEECRNQTFH
jgi:hypothetical protein